MAKPFAQQINPGISVLNRSTLLGDNEVQAVVPALQQQVADHFQPAWGINANLNFVPTSQIPPAGSWWLVVLDDSDQAGALGYHDLTPEGLPLGKVFAGSDLKYGTSWTLTASHELLEMLADPDIDLTVFLQTNDTAGRLYAYEVADACEADQYGYKIGDVLVSDFVFPSWFESFRQPNSVQFDYQRQITQPFQILPGGYIGVFDVASGSGWQEITAEHQPSTINMRGHVGSRRERRRILRDNWLRSADHKIIENNAREYSDRMKRKSAA